jgi:hypothetical protein
MFFGAAMAGWPLRRDPEAVPTIRSAGRGGGFAMGVILYDRVGVEDRGFSPHCWRTRGRSAINGSCARHGRPALATSSIAGGFKSIPVIEDRRGRIVDLGDRPLSGDLSGAAAVRRPGRRGFDPVRPDLVRRRAARGHRADDHARCLRASLRTGPGSATAGNSASAACSRRCR